MRLWSAAFTGNDPRKGWRIPLNEIKYNEQRDNDADGILRLVVEATDQNGHTSYVFSNVREQPTVTIDPLGAKTVFHYDHIGQLQESKDPEGHSTYHAYDMLGRRTDRIHPSAGHTRWDYDPAGNMTRLTQNSGEYIEYFYEYNRPVHIMYSNRPWNNVWYKYGNSGTEAGRVVYQRDATGVQQFHYDLMGNVDTNWHTYVQPHLSSTLSLKTAWRYDSWGRVQNITYPDREKVDYRYDFGGQLYSIDGYKSGHVGHTPYIREILYDHFGQRTQVIDGDGVKTTYDYNPATRRLAHLMNYSIVTRETLQDNLYYYDAVGNIDSIRDNGRNHRLQTYKYDDANRLVGSTGSMTQEYSTALPYSYGSGYKYSPAGRFLNKHVKSDRLSTSQGPRHVAYDNTYFYTHPDNPYAITHIQDPYGAQYNFHWDAKGNMVHADGGNPYSDRRLCWTEDNRLQAFMERGDEGGIAAYYNYSADGERNIKLTSPRLNIQQNASLFNNPPLVYPTLYASSLITLTPKGYTKHYFEEGRRICSKLGGGMRGNVTVEEIDSRVGEMASSYEKQYHTQNDGIRHTFHDCIGADPQIIEDINLHRMLVEREVRRDEEEPTYFYHSDHLGSAAYLTYHGGVIQTLNYLPYGEDWVELNFFAPHDTTRLGIYRFNGKEKDYESGFHYYGARYYWSELTTMWLSVDPMSDKYPSISPYAYCAWNPVILIDPDGMKFDSVSQIEVNKLKKQATLNWYKGYKGDIVSALNQREYNSTLNEITKLELSNQWYHITKHDGDFLVKGKWKAAGWTHYLLEPNVVEIEYNGTLGTLSHECKHAFQFDIGSLSFDETGDWSGSLYDFFDEKEAYVRGAAFGRKSLSEDEIKKTYNYPPMTYTTINSEPSNPNRSIEAILNAKKNTYRKNGNTYKAGIKVTNQ